MQHVEVIMQKNLLYQDYNTKMILLSKLDYRN